MNRFATLFPFLIRVSPLRWQQVFGTGSAILAAFLALARAAWSLDLTDLLSFNLFCAIYWLFIYLSIYLEIRWGVSEGTKQWMKAALTQVKEKPYMVFFLNIFFLVLCYALIFLCYLMLAGDKETFVKILLIMGECSAIFFCVCSQNELSRFQAVLSFFMSYFFNIIILEKLSEHIFFYLFFLFLVLEFLIVEYKGFFSVNFLFFVILLAYLCICPEILLWGFALVLLLILLYLLLFFFQNFLHKEEESSSTPNKSLFFALLFLLVSLLFKMDFRDTGFHLQILFLGAGALVIYLCFISKTGWEQVITSLSYIIINVIIGGVITESTSVFLRNSILYLTVNLLIFCYFYGTSLKKKESLKKIFDQGKVRIFLSKFVFLVGLLSNITVNSTYSWIWPWLTTFASQIGGLNLFLFFFDKKEDEFFQTLGRKQTTFLCRLIIYGGAVFFFLLYPADAFILLLNPFFVKNLYKGSNKLWQILFTKK